MDFDHGLNKAINKIRDALGDSAESPRFVETIARRGYRFLAEVKACRRSACSQPGTRISVSSRGRGSVIAGSAGKLPIVQTFSAINCVEDTCVRAGSYWWHLSPSGRLHSWNRPSPVIRSLAVLPLESLSSDASQDYFADGMTDELISDLGQISALRVISRTSVMAYKHARKPLPQIARELNVDAVVEGTVLRSGDQVRITAQLIEASTDKHLWSQSYEGELRDTLALQNTGG